jgi:hypothetical protein
MSFILTPAGDAYSISRIGGAKAVEGGFILFGAGPDEILEYQEAPTAVAIAWRNATVALLGSYRPNRPVRQIDWLGLAATVDEPWARQQGWTAPAGPATPPAAPVATATPKRINPTPPKAAE